MPGTIYTLLKKDHDEIKPMLKELATGKEDRLETMARELKVHSEAEEHVLYKALEKYDETKELVAEGYKEHKEADKLSKSLMRAKGNKEKFAETAKKLQEAVQHHIKEEEGPLFTGAKSVLPQDEAKKMGQEFEAQKERMMAKV